MSETLEDCQDETLQLIFLGCCTVILDTHELRERSATLFHGPSARRNKQMQSYGVMLPYSWPYLISDARPKYCWYLNTTALNDFMEKKTKLCRHCESQTIRGDRAELSSSVEKCRWLLNTKGSLDYHVGSSLSHRLLENSEIQNLQKKASPYSLFEKRPHCDEIEDYLFSVSSCGGCLLYLYSTSAQQGLNYSTIDKMRFYNPTGPGPPGPDGIAGPAVSPGMSGPDGEFLKQDHQVHQNHKATTLAKLASPAYYSGLGKLGYTAGVRRGEVGAGGGCAAQASGCPARPPGPPGDDGPYEEKEQGGKNGQTESAGKADIESAGEQRITWPARLRGSAGPDGNAGLTGPTGMPGPGGKAGGPHQEPEETTDSQGNQDMMNNREHQRSKEEYCYKKLDATKADDDDDDWHEKLNDSLTADGELDQSTEEPYIYLAKKCL
ncbi:unnamed protein product [Caenorhabditis nigoni]